MFEGRIDVTGLSKDFGAVRAVRGLTFTVEPGSVTGFLGPNGAGKTTTLRMLLGLVRPTGGTATIDGRAFDDIDNPGRVVGAVLEAQGFHPGRGARDHLRCYAAAMGVPARRVAEVIELVGLTPAAGRPARGYSLGMRQRLALATALLGDPHVLVLDEPANGLDPEGIAWLRGFLQTFARTGRTVLVSSHILAEVEQTVDRVVIVSRGECVYDGHLDQLRAGQRRRVLVEAGDPVALVAALRDAGMGDIDLAPDGRLSVSDVDRRQVGDVALAAGVAVYGMAEERVDLEQVFLHLTSGQFATQPAYGPGYGPPPGQGIPLRYAPPPGHGPGYRYGPVPGAGPGYGPPFGHAPGYGPPTGYPPTGPPYGPYGPPSTPYGPSYGPPSWPGGPPPGYQPGPHQVPHGYPQVPPVEPPSPYARPVEPPSGGVP